MKLRLLHAPGGNFVTGPGLVRACSREPACSLAWAKATDAYRLTEHGHCDPACPTFDPAPRAADVAGSARFAG